MVTGYLHPLYAASLKEFGEPFQLPRSGGWLLRRPIPGSEDFDAMGVYPLFCCQDWQGLRDDLDELARQDLVALSLVADPFGAYSPEELRACFDGITAFKEHFVVDLSRQRQALITKTHRKLARRGLRRVAVDVPPDPAALLDDWCRLFAVLAERHRITSLRAFSREAFARQLEVPGLVVFRGTFEGEVAALDLWYVQDHVAQGHLAAFSERGYENFASYATKWCALEHFRGRLRWMNLGGAPGSGQADGEGLARFKRGWATGTRTAWFCRRVLDEKRYAELTPSTEYEDDTYFPAYRRGEFS